MRDALLLDDFMRAGGKLVHFNSTLISVSLTQDTYEIEQLKLHFLSCFVFVNLFLSVSFCKEFI